MRLICILLAILTYGGVAQASCKQTQSFKRTASVATLLESFGNNVDCLEERMDLLEYQNETLIEQVEILEEIAARVPSNFFVNDGQDNGATSPFAVASFEMTAKPKGRVFDSAIDHSVFLDLCADAEGCVVSLFSSSQTARNSDNLGKLGPCELTYDQDSGAWAFGAECGGGRGIDSEGRLPGAENPEGSVVLNIGNDCALTESALNVRADEAGQVPLSRDRKQGFHLITGLNMGDGQVPEDDYSCRLTLRD